MGSGGKRVATRPPHLPVRMSSSICRRMKSSPLGSSLPPCGGCGARGSVRGSLFGGRASAGFGGVVSVLDVLIVLPLSTAAASDRDYTRGEQFLRGRGGPLQGSLRGLARAEHHLHYRLEAGGTSVNG